MQDILLKIRKGIEELFPLPVQFEVGTETPLDRIPNWDSMNSVNFKIFLEEVFNIEVPDDLLDGETTIGEIIGYIRNPIS